MYSGLRVHSARANVRPCGDGGHGNVLLCGDDHENVLFCESGNGHDRPRGAHVRARRARGPQCTNKT